MKHIRTTALASLLALAVAAQADDKVTVVTTQGETSYDISSVARIDLGDTELKVVAADGTGTTYAFDEVTKIIISGDATAINAPASADASRLTLTVAQDGTWMRINGWDASQTSALTLYGTDGQTLLRLDSWSGETVDIASLPHGVYVVKAGTHTAKFRK